MNRAVKLPYTNKSDELVVESSLTFFHGLAAESQLFNFQKYLTQMNQGVT